MGTHDLPPTPGRQEGSDQVIQIASSLLTCGQCVGDRSGLRITRGKRVTLQLRRELAVRGLPIRIGTERGQRDAHSKRTFLSSRMRGRGRTRESR